ncbi:hypothetical protein LXA43DRAFT_1091784 [Ganoderma leucocontextum]|nr:hypothetical protein LXA43DRAFT_1097387 [Ganoderma leucocontextum]KAI1794734.1 hypothetical protein LXA43DRAFT_1091784 [Ganoderma leucocontextum]
MRLRLSKWLRSVRGKSKASDLSPNEGAGEPPSEIPAETGGEDGSLSLSVALDHRALIPQGISSSSRSGTGTSGVSYGKKAERQQLSKRCAPKVLPVPTSHHVEVIHQAVPHTIIPLYTHSGGQPRMAMSAVPNPSPIHLEQAHNPIQCSTFIGPSQLIHWTSPVLDTPTTFLPRHTAHAGSQHSLVSTSSFNSPSELAASEERESTSYLEAFGEEMELDSRFLMSQDVDQMFAPPAPGHQWPIQSLVRQDFDLDVGAKTYDNINDRATSLAANLNLRSISEAWMNGLRAHAGSSA